MEERTLDDGVETSITDEIESDLDAIGITNLGERILSYVEEQGS